MVNLVFSANAVLPLFLIMAAGYLFRRNGLFTEPFLTTANKFCFTAALPALLFKNAYSAAPGDLFNPLLVGLTVFAIVSIALLSCIFVPMTVKDPRKASAIIQGIYRSNAALFSIPLASNIFGEAGIAPITMLLAIVVPLYNVLAVIILSVFSSHSKDAAIKNIWRQLLSNKLIWGTLTGLLLSTARIKLPFAVESAVFSISAIATPLAMLCIGASFDFSAAAKNLKYTLPTSFLRLVAVPLGATALGVAAGLRGTELGVMYIIFAAPVASSSFIMAKNMGSDSQLAGEIIVVTTLLSLFTVFGGVYILKSLMLI